MRYCKIILLLVAFYLQQHIAWSQVYPVQGSAVLIPPYSVYLSDYTSRATDRLVLNIALKDIARPELRVRLRVRIESTEVKIETKQEYIGTAISLQGGIPLRLGGSELFEYFNPNNLTFSGITRREFEKTGALPQGFYQICFDVYEYNRGVKISNSICAPAWLILNDPPIINLPQDNAMITPTLPQNVVLQWTPRHTGSPNSAFSTAYEIKMVEVWPSTRNPNDAILTSPPILEATTNSTSYIYGPAETPLELGRRYAFRVQAKSIVGAEEYDLFKNNGYSTVYSFVYGEACNTLADLKAESKGATRFSVKWTPMQNHTGFKLRNREAGTNNWYENASMVSEMEITSLKPGTNYEYQVIAACGAFESPYSTIAKIKTKDAPAGEFACGVPLENFELDPSQLLPTLKVGDVIRSGDFDVTVSKVSGANGVFSGEGAIEVPFFNRAKAKVEFESVTVNKDYRQVNGAMKVTGAAVEIVPAGVLEGLATLTETLDAIDSALNTIEENLPQEFDEHAFVADNLVSIPGEISSVYQDSDGTVVVVDDNGNEKRLEKGETYAVKDDEGNGYLIDSKGKIHQTTAEVAVKAANRELNLVMKFTASDQAMYGFDDAKFSNQLPTEYETMKGGYVVAWKSVKANGNDPVTAALQNNDIDKSKVRFEASGVVVPAPPIGSNQLTTVPVPGGTDGSVIDMIAMYTPADTAKKDQFLGKLKVVSYDQIDNQLVIVPVNNASAKGAAGEIQNGLNKLYNQAVVNWTVSIAENITVTFADKFDDGQSGLLSNYTADMKKVISAYKSRMEDGKYYLFLIDNPKSGAGALGYMPRGKQAGFIFANNHAGVADITQTMAHELGHGAFNLPHTFDDERLKLDKNTTDNVMDYPSGNKFYKFQWGKMRFPDIVVGLFEEDEAGESIAFNLAGIPEDYKNSGNYSFFAPSGNVITLPKNTSYVVVSTGDPLFNRLTGQLSENIGPVGSLWWFQVGANKYVVKSTSDGIGYWSEEKQEYYVDVLSKSCEINNILVGLPFFETALGFELHKVTPGDAVVFKNDTKNFGAIQEEQFIIVDKAIDRTKTLDGIANGSFEPLSIFSLLDQSGQGIPVAFQDNTGFSPAGQGYLDAHAKYAGRGSALAPIIIANAYWISMMRGTEATSVCNLGATLTKNAKIEDYIKRLDEQVMNQEVILTPDQAQQQKLNNAWSMYYAFRNDLTSMNQTVTQVANVNSALSSSVTDNGYKVLTLIKPLSTCELESITFDNRLKAIDLLIAMDGEEAETQIVRLVTTVTYNAQIAQISDRIFKDSGKLYARLYKRLDLSDFDLYEGKLSEIRRFLNEENNFSDKISVAKMENVNGTLRECFFETRYDAEKGQVVITKNYKVSDEHGTVNFLLWTKPLSLTDYIEVEFPANALLYLHTDKPNNGEKLVLPAFALQYMLSRKEREESFKVVRVLGNGIALFASLYTGGGAMTVWTGISVGLAGGDILITMAQDDLQRNEYGKFIVGAWDLIQWADMGAGAANVGRALFKQATEKVGTFLIRIKVPELIADIKTGNGNSRITKAIRETVWRLRLMNLNGFADLLNAKLLAEVNAAEIASTFNAVEGTNASLQFTNWVECAVDVKGTKYSLFDIDANSAGPFIRGEVSQVGNFSDEVVGEFARLDVLENATGLVVTKSKVKVAFDAVGKRIRIYSPIVDNLSSFASAKNLGVLGKWFDEITDISKRAEIHGILKEWEPALLSKLENAILLYPGLRGELFVNTKLFKYYQAIQSDWWAKFGLLREHFLSMDYPESSRQFFLSDNFRQVTLDLFDPAMVAKIVDAIPKKNVPSILGNIFEDILMERIGDGFRRGVFTDLPPSLRVKFEQMGRHGYQVMVTQSKISLEPISTLKPQPDMLFFRVDELGDISYEDVIFIDAKLNVNFTFEGPQKALKEFVDTPNRASIFGFATDKNPEIFISGGHNYSLENNFLNRTFSVSEAGKIGTLFENDVVNLLHR